MQRKSYFFTANFSDVRNYLKQHRSGVVFEGNDASALAAVLSDHDHRQDKRHLWTADGSGSDYDVSGARVIYNGPNDEFKPTNSKFDRVMILELGNPFATPDCRLYLQYNDAEQD